MKARLSDFCDTSHGLNEWLADLLWDVNTLGSDAYLAGVKEDNLWCNLSNVNVWKNDAGIIATPVNYCQTVVIRAEKDHKHLHFECHLLSVLAAAAIIFFPVAIEPVKLIFAISG